MSNRLRSAALIAGTVAIIVIGILRDPRPVPQTEVSLPPELLEAYLLLEQAQEKIIEYAKRNP